MIKSKDGAVEVKGSTTDLLSDLSMIIRALRETFDTEDIPQEVGDKLINKAVELGFWTEEELAKENNKLVKELMDLILGESKNE